MRSEWGSGFGASQWSSDRGSPPVTWLCSYLVCPAYVSNGQNSVKRYFIEYLQYRATSTDLQILSSFSEETMAYACLSWLRQRDV